MLGGQGRTPGAAHSQAGKAPALWPQLFAGSQQPGLQVPGLGWGLSRQCGPLNSHSSGQLPLWCCVPLAARGHQLEKVSDPESALSPHVGNKTKLLS